MRNTTKIPIILCLLLAGCGSGCSDQSSSNDPPAAAPGSSPPPSTSNPADTLEANLQGLTFDDFVDESWRALTLRSPELVVALADPALDAAPLELTDISSDYALETTQMVSVIDGLLGNFDINALTRSQQITLKVYDWYLEDTLAAADSPHMIYPASFFSTSVPARLERFFGELHPLATESDARNYLARLELVDEKLLQLRTIVRDQMNSGIVMPAQMLEWSIGRWNGTATNAPKQTIYYLRLEEAVADMPEAVQTEILGDAENIIQDEVIPAFADLVTQLQDQRDVAPIDIGIGQFENGREFYRYALRHHTSTAMTPDEVHDLGLAELDRIHREMRALFDELGFPENQTIAQQYARLADESGVEPTDQIVPAYETIVTNASTRLGEAFDVLPRADVIVVGGDIGGFYVRPAKNGSRPGAFHVSITNPDFRYMMKSLAYHEAVPGHHLQIAVAQEQALSSFRQQFHSTAFIEGWALYAERLALELGWYDGDAFGDLGRLQFEAWRAARLVVDTGIHDRGWSFTEAVNFFRENTGLTQNASQGQIARYMAWPGQATAYMVGMLAILDTREALQATQGEDFDLKTFHNTLLTAGAVPISLLDELFE